MGPEPPKMARGAWPPGTPHGAQSSSAEVGGLGLTHIGVQGQVGTGNRRGLKGEKPSVAPAGQGEDVGLALGEPGVRVGLGTQPAGGLEEGRGQDAACLWLPRLLHTASYPRVGGREEKEGGESKGGRWGQRGNVGRDQEGVGQDRGHQWGEAEGKPQKRGG